jgi:hypothetical protein
MEEENLEYWNSEMMEWWSCGRMEGGNLAE